ncbi:MAG: acyl-CoA dehydrogenase family protein [Chloroflexi bacterium]|nr:acyl-CoA dehydrogenase family protein [Chloroflexota bacterium]
MRYEFTPEEEAFRAELLGWIENEVPEEYKGIGEAGSDEEWENGLKVRRQLADKGWLTLAWPTEYGGQGAPMMQQVIFNEEMVYHRVPGRDGFGTKMLAPTLMVHGTEEQRRKYLPPIARGEVQWCQGYSEPDSGSDLASLQMRAVDDGDDFVVNGSKIWTSGAHRADWIFFLVRTDPDAPKHRGISFLLAPMSTPGITVEPIINMAGHHAFNQVFFEDVRVPKENLVGELNRGWYVAATLLDFERSGIDYPAQARRTLDDLTEYAHNTLGADGRPLSKDPDVRRRLVELGIETDAARSIAYQVADMQARGEIPNKEASMSKTLGTSLVQSVYRFGVDLLGMYGQLRPGSPRAVLDGRMLEMQLITVAYTIFAGTTEIQKNIIATRGLGLPRG